METKNTPERRTERNGRKVIIRRIDAGKYEVLQFVTAASLIAARRAVVPSLSFAITIRDNFLNE